MEEKKIVIKINEDAVEMLSNNPDLKSLVVKIVEQNDDYDFDLINIECNDEKFDKEGFKEILIKSIKEFKQNLVLNAIKSKKNIDEVKKINDDLTSLNNQ